MINQKTIERANVRTVFRSKPVSAQAGMLASQI